MLHFYSTFMEQFNTSFTYTQTASLRTTCSYKINPIFPFCDSLFYVFAASGEKYYIIQQNKGILCPFHITFMWKHECEQCHNLYRLFICVKFTHPGFSNYAIVYSNNLYHGDHTISFWQAK